VELFEADAEIGGQFTLARRIPGKEEFAETLRYFTRRLETTGVKVQLNRRVTADDLAGFDEVILASGVLPRTPAIPGIDRPNVHGYADVITGRATVGERVAVIGAGGIGFDVTELLTHRGAPGVPQPVAEWLREWGVVDPATHRGAVTAPQPEQPARQVFLLQRKSTAAGKGLGKTTGWVHRASIKARGVTTITGVTYDRIDDAGLHITVDGRPRLLEVDDVVVCAGQESRRELVEPLRARGLTVHVIGGADVAAELDAKRAIDQGTRLAAAL
jgi:2,4-dienoyl-CoA reductase (NADPH2)